MSQFSMQWIAPLHLLAMLSNHVASKATVVGKRKLRDMRGIFSSQPYMWLVISVHLPLARTYSHGFILTARETGKWRGADG